MSNEIKESQREITTQQELVIVKLLAGQNQTAAAAEVGLAKETITRWMTGDPNFVAALNAAREELWRSNMDWLRSLAEEAVATIGGLMDSANHAIRLKAALCVLDLATREPFGPTTSEEVEEGWAKDARMKERAEQMEALLDL